MLFEHIPNIYPSCTSSYTLLYIYKILCRNEQKVYIKVYVRYMIGTCLANMYLPCSHDILRLSRGLRYMFEQKSEKLVKKDLIVVVVCDPMRHLFLST